jgi:hypothetical protein
MRKALLGLALAFLMTGGSASAETLVEWEWIEGVTGSDLPFDVGPFHSSARSRLVGDGSASINLKTGLLTFEVKRLSLARPAPDLPEGSDTFARAIGAAGGGTWIGTIVCNSLSASADSVDSGPVQFVEGSGRFRGFVELPASCLVDAPREIAFLLRAYEDGAGGPFVAFGAGRSFR